ncbi:MAG: hypothetical protein WBO55_09865 [Rhizobiaceae bacterium]
MLQGILYFGLGFLSSALIALMISPAIWNRAVTLTRKRIESSVPLTLNEIQADKDQLRAEFAMSTRRLEMSIDELREKASRQLIEIGRKRDELARLSEESRERVVTIEELESRASEMRSQLKDREERLAATNRRLDEARLDLETKAAEVEQMRARLVQSETDADSARIELVAKQTAMENLSDKVGDFSRNSGSVRKELEAARQEYRQLQRELDTEREKSAALAARFERTQKQLDESEASLGKRERDLSHLREATASDDSVNSELTSQLVHEKSRTVELEAKLAQATLQMEALLADASNDNVEKAMASLNKDKERLETKMASVAAERDQLKADLDALTRVRSDDWDAERGENAILRERINDLAAQVTAMTSALEGNNSAIHEILKSAPSKKEKSGTAKASRSEAGDNVRPVRSLADRIRALQDSARQNRTG